LHYRFDFDMAHSKGYQLQVKQVDCDRFLPTVNPAVSVQMATNHISLQQQLLDVFH